MSKKRQQIVILGAGFAGIYTYFHLHKHFHGRDDVRITLVSNHDYFLFVTLLHEVATGSLLPLSITQSIRSLSLCCIHYFIEGTVHIADIDRKVVTVDKRAQGGDGTSERVDLVYDYLVSALGSTANFFNTLGADTHAFALKTQADAKAIKNRFIDNFVRANELDVTKEQEKLLQTVVIGGGPTGVEVAGELADYVNHEMYTIYPKLSGKAKVTICQSGERLLPQVDSWFDIKAREILEGKKNVDVLFNTRVTEITCDSIKIKDKELPAGLTIWTAGVKAQELTINAKKPVETEERTGRIKVNAFLQVPHYPHTFVIGDQAWVYDKERGVPYPMRAQFAQREGKAAAENINNLLFGRPLREFEWKDQGFIVSLGKGGALAEIYGMKFSGWFAWWVYRTVYASKIVGARAKLRTIVEWTLNLFYPRDVSKL